MTIVAGTHYNNRNERSRRPAGGPDDPASSLPCPFEEAILSRKCGCRLALRSSVGSRQKVQCNSAESHQDCAEMLNYMRKSVNFSLGLAHAPNALPRAQAKKLQCGTLIGLQNALDLVVENDRVNNIHDTVQRAKKRYGSVEEFPEQQIVRCIASYGK
jgi:hypothetical protein